MEFILTCAAFLDVVLDGLMNGVLFPKNLGHFVVFNLFEFV